MKKPDPRNFRDVSDYLRACREYRQFPPPSTICLALILAVMIGAIVASLLL